MSASLARGIEDYSNRPGDTLKDTLIRVELIRGRDRDRVEQVAVPHQRRKYLNRLGAAGRFRLVRERRRDTRAIADRRAAVRDGRPMREFPCASESMSSSVAVCRSCVSLRAMPISTPCVNTTLPFACP